MMTLSSFAAVYPRAIGVVFLGIAAIMISSPATNLSADGVEFGSFPIAGKAEVRAYYFGTALAVAWTCLTSETKAALKQVAVVLGGFASARVVGYAVDGVDTNSSFRHHQHAVFALEILGSLAAGTLLRCVGGTQQAKSSTS